MRKLFSKGEKGASNLGNLMTQFLNTIYDFWHLKYVQEKKGNVSYWPAIFNTLQEKDLPKIWIVNFKRWKKEDAKHKLQNATYFYNKYLTLECLYNFTIDYPKEKINVDLQDIASAFETYVTFTNLKHCCAMLNSSQFRQLNTSTALIENITNEVESRKLHDIPSIKLYHTAFLMLKYPADVSHFQQLKFLLAKKDAQILPTSYLPKDEALFIYTLALNYCNGKIINGNIDYYREMFDLYKYLISEKLLYEQAENSNQKYITINYIKNIVTIGIKLKELAWTKKFVVTNRKEVLPSLQKDCYKFNMALLHFQEHAYEKVIEALRDIEYINYFYQIDCRVLLLKTYYETENSELLVFLSDTFRKQLTNNKLNLSKNRKNAYKNFNNYLLKLCKLRDKVRKKNMCLDLHKLVESMEKAAYISDKQWLLEKINALKVQHKCS
ncbi:MAG: hypothetical protein ACPG5B_04825 [Chitinophagales bacterium]